MNSVKKAMKLPQHHGCSHPVPNHHILAVKDPQYSWQIFIKAEDER